MKKKENIIKKIVKFTKSQDLDVIPKKTKKILNLLILDWLAVALAGQKEPVSKIVRQLEKNNGGKKESFVIGLLNRLPSKSATFINAVTGHALDYDDTHFESLGHTSTVVISSALAVSDRNKSDVKVFKEGVLVGIETAIRIGIWLGRKHYHQGFHVTATAGIFGSAVAAAHILGLSKRKTINAIGIASSSSSGIKAQFGSMAKPIQVGFAASRGVESAFLAQKGIKPDSKILDKADGYGATYSAEFKKSAFLNLGKKYFINDVKFKFHACCHGTHSSIEALIYLRDNYQLKESIIDMIQIFINPQYLKICNIEKPKSGLEIKFSYKMIAALIINKFNTTRLDTFSDRNCNRKKLLSFCKKVKIIANNKILETQSKVIITLVNGKTLKKKYDILDKVSFETLENKLFLKAKSLLGEQISSKLWCDKLFENSLPSNWIENNLKYFS
ncbi:MAG: MmgE/PrpD family protein [Paracoccaceae bacterium]